jgi:hypothetical protein
LMAKSITSESSLRIFDGNHLSVFLQYLSFWKT